MSQIKAGDLVMLVQSCHGQKLGAIFTVAGFRQSKRLQCSACGFKSEPVLFAEASESISDLTHAPVQWLKRIPPLDELESEKNKEELTA